MDEPTLRVPLRYALYSKGKLGEWQYHLLHRQLIPRIAAEIKSIARNVAVQVLYSDILSILWYVAPKILNDPASLGCLWPREWADWQCEYGGSRLRVLPGYREAIVEYAERTVNQDPYSNSSDAALVTEDSYASYSEQAKAKINWLWLRDCSSSVDSGVVADIVDHDVVEDGVVDYCSDSRAWRRCLKQWRKDCRRSLKDYL
ncbi:hypothetical protein F5B20DRAFT_425980 [Whalleya microplaca]|nr:hypothetical protein F5B20DRAFT_425980 [Whalleya microplaca]